MVYHLIALIYLFVMAQGIFPNTVMKYRVVEFVIPYDPVNGTFILYKLSLPVPQSKSTHLYQTQLSHSSFRELKKVSTTIGHW